VTVTGGLLVLVFAIVKAQGYGWGSSRTIGLFVLAFALLGAFVVIERRSKAPLIRLGIFRMRSLSGSNVAMLLVASGLFAMFYFASLYMQEILGYGPLKAGIAFVPFTLGIIVGAVASQALIRRIGIRIVVFTGITMGTAGLLYFARLPAHGSYVPDLLPTIAVVSIGMGMTFVPLTLLATTNVERADAGLASGLFNTSQQVGGALGLAILSTLAASRTSNLLGGRGVVSSVAVRDSALTSGYHVAFAVGAAMLLAALVVLAVTIRKQDVVLIDSGEASLTPA
jgi:predicted MFS family arabinose efflux permease